MPHATLYARSCRAAERPRIHGATALSALVLAFGLLACPKTSAAPDPGLGLRADEAGWSRWQGRLGVATPRGTGLAYQTGAANAPSLSLFGDYYFLQQGAVAPGRYGGGFRATGGLLVGPRGTAVSTPADNVSALGTGFSTQRRSFSLWSALPSEGEQDATSRPYLGVGYTGLKSLRATGGGWGFSADVGVMALQPRSAVRLGQQSLNEVVRDLHLSPLLQLGVSYSF